MSHSDQDKSTVEIAAEVLARGDSEATVKLGPNEIVITTDFERSDFNGFQIFVVNGLEVALGRKSPMVRDGVQVASYRSFVATRMVVDRMRESGRKERLPGTPVDRLRI